MLKLILHIVTWMRKEPCSIQKELINRSQKRRATWDHDNIDLIELYDHLDLICKKRTRPGSLKLSQFSTLLKYPSSSLNFLNGRMVPINDLERFRSEATRK